MDIRLSPISPDDAEPIVELFNHYVRHGFAAFAEQPLPVAFFAKLLESAAGRPTVAAKDAEGRLLGFGLLRPHGPFATTAHVAEITYFVAPDCTGQGIGSRMLREFKEYRPYDNIARFRREMGKYVDSTEVARLEQYVKVN